jgi:ABC-type microcin C transport system permease subunit YejB
VWVLAHLGIRPGDAKEVKSYDFFGVLALLLIIIGLLIDPLFLIVAMIILVLQGGAYYRSHKD